MRVADIDTAMSKAPKASSPWEPAKSSLLVHVGLLIVCAENSLHSFLPQIFMAWKLLPYRDSYQKKKKKKLNQPPYLSIYHKPCLLVQLDAITPPPCSTVYNKHADLPGHPVFSSLSVFSLFSHCPGQEKSLGASLVELPLSGSKWYKDAGLLVVATAEQYGHQVAASAMGLLCQKSRTRSWADSSRGKARALVQYAWCLFVICGSNQI